MNKMENRPNCGKGRHAADIIKGGIVKVGGFTLQHKRAAIVVLFCIVLCAAAYICGAVYYSSHFYNNTIMSFPSKKSAVIDISGMTAEEAEDAVGKSISEYELHMKKRHKDTAYPSNMGTSVKGTDISISHNGKAVSDALSAQNGWAWLSKNGKQHKATYDGVTYDGKKLKKILQDFSKINTEEEPKDAYLDVTSEGCSIVPEQNGCRVDVGKAAEIIGTAIKNQEPSVFVEDIYETPKVTADSKELKALCDRYNGIIGGTYTLSFHDGAEETVTGGDIYGMLSDDGKDVSVDDGAVKKLVGGWADKYTTYGKRFTFTDMYGEKRTVDCGDYGWTVDVDKTALDFKKAVSKGGGASVKASYTKEAFAWENGSIGGTYIEISIGGQEMSVYKDGERVLRTDIVTGLPGGGRNTIKGVWTAGDVQRDAAVGLLSTNNTSATADLFIPFNGMQGLISAPWRDNFGGDVYITDGTSGCVDVAPQDMDELVRYAEAGEPVIIY